MLTYEHVEVDTLTPHPANPRRGDVDAIADSLATNGQYRPIVASTRTRHVLAGNHTLAAARLLGWQSIDVVWVDVDEAGEACILAADNRTAELATYDERALLDLLVTLDDLAGTGYDPADLRALEALLSDAAHARSDDDVARDAAEAGQPIIRARVSHALYRVFREVPGDDDAERIEALLIGAELWTPEDDE